jgi:RNA polymerase sigma factor (sigma-70 family)
LGNIFCYSMCTFMNSLADEQLVNQYLVNKDEQFLEELVKRYLPLIFGFVKRYTGNEDNASDITQEVFVKVWKNIKSFDQIKSFKTWIFTIAKRTAIDELRKQKAIPFSVLQEEGFENSIADESPSILDQIFSQQQSKELVLALAKLPVNYNSVINLRADDDLSFREIAVKLEEPLNTIKSRYRRGLALLKELL